MMENLEEHKWKVKFDVLAMRVQWTLGMYYHAGKSYGRFWKHLMGEPTWSVDMSSEKMKRIEVDNRDQASALLNSNSLFVLTGQDHRDELKSCWTPDPIAFDVYDAIIENIKDPFDQAEFDKYVTVAQVLDASNIIKGCSDNKKLMEHLGMFKKKSDDFWKKPDAKEKSERNVKDNWDEFIKVVETLKKSWAAGDYETAGVAYGKFWGIQMG